MAVSGVDHPQGGWPAAVFYPLGDPTPYAHERKGKGHKGNVWVERREESKCGHSREMMICKRCENYKRIEGGHDRQSK
jgi:hypothetical protein